LAPNFKQPHIELSFNLILVSETSQAEVCGEWDKQMTTISMDWIYQW
jgi:hypothetical protein